MLEAIEFENVQNIKSAILELHPRFNIIIGTSDHGKSALIRGIKWAVRNDADIDLMNWDAKRGESCSTAMQFDDGFIVRSKSKSKNFYVTSLSDEPLEAFRKGIPEDVEKITRMTEINIKSQDDPFLFFQKSPGEVARMLNRVVGNENIDVYFKRISKIISDTDRHKTHLENEIKEHEKKIEELNWLDEANNNIQRVELHLKSIKEIEYKIEKLDSAIYILKECESDSAKIKSWLVVEHDYKTIKDKVKSYHEINEKYKHLCGVLNRCYDLIKNKEQLKVILGMEESVKKMITSIQKISNMRNREVLISNALQSIDNMSKKSETLRIRVKSLENKRDQILSSFDICPLCKQPMKGI